MIHTSPGHLIWMAIWAGIVGTVGMELLLRSITKSGLASADMARAIGSVFTKSLDSAYGLGMVIQTFNGIIFGVIYTGIITYMNIHGFINCAGAGLLIGFIHGAVVGFVLVAVVAEHHPLPKFRDAGFEVAIAHWAGHLAYGLMVGAVIGLMDY